LRTAVEILFGRVEQLTAIASKHNIGIPPLDVDKQSLLEQVYLTLELPPSNTTLPTYAGPNALAVQVPHSPPNTETFPDVALYDEGLAMSTVQDASVIGLPWAQTQDTDLDVQNWSELFTSSSWEESPSDWSWQVLNDFSGFPPFTVDPPPGSIQPETEDRPENLGSGNTSEDEVETDIVPRLAARFGSLRVAADGQLRYYGTASNYHFLTGFRHSECKIDVEDVHRAMRSALENAQLDEEAPLALQNHLLDLFFNWHNPSHCTVDRTMFETARTQDSKYHRAYCSPSLVNAM
jgi:hypothetical protein